MKKTIFILFFAILFSSLCFAVPPFQSSQTNLNTLTIIYPKNEYYKVNTSINIHLHVYNSTGFLLTNVSTSCFIHIYDKKNNHIVQSNLSFDTNQVDFFYSLNGSLLQDRSIYPYLVECKNNKESGFVSTSFEVTTDGNIPKQPGSVLAIIIFLPMLFGFILLFGAINLNDEHKILKEILFFLMPICFWVSLHMGIAALVEFYKFEALQNIIGDTINWSGLLFWLLIGYYAIYILYTVFSYLFDMKKKKKMERENE